MLTTSLRNLQRAAFCNRRVFPTMPPHAEYELTKLGGDVLVPVRALDNRPPIDEGRRCFDGRTAAATRRTQSLQVRGNGRISSAASIGPAWRPASGACAAA